MPRHYIAHVIPDRPIGATPAAADLTWSGPRGHGTDQHGSLVLECGTGDVLWLLSWLQVTPGGRSGPAIRMPPSLDARIVVDLDQLDRPDLAKLRAAKETVFPAGSGSAWLPLRDASPLLQRLRVRTRSGGPARRLLSRPTYQRAGRTVRPSVGARMAMGLQSFSVLTDHSAALLEQARRRDRASATVFVSYRTSTGQRPAAELVAALCRHAPVWFDGWSMPSRLTQLDHADTHDGIHAAVSRAIADAALSVRVVTPGYGSSPWTRAENELIAQRGRLVDWTPGQETVAEVVERVLQAMGP